MRAGSWEAPDPGAVVFFGLDNTVCRGRVREVRVLLGGCHVAIQFYTVDGDQRTHVVPIGKCWSSPVDACNEIFGAAPEPALS